MAEFESCDKCKYNEKSETEYPCNQCIHNATDKFKPMTRADKIRSMSDEELAGLTITYNDYYGEYYCSDGECYGCREDAIRHEIEYLQSEAE